MVNDGTTTSSSSKSLLEMYREPKAIPRDVLFKKNAKSFILTMGMFLLAHGGYRTIKAGDPLSYMIPNLMLMTPLHRFVVPVWDYLDPPSRLSENNFLHKPVRTILAEDYTLERLILVSENYRYPVVVRGMFANSTAVRRWTSDKEYLINKMGHFDIKVARRTVNETQVMNQTRMSFGTAFSDLLSNEDYKGFMFFPFFASKRSDVKVNPINVESNKIVQSDLNLDQIWKGFGNYDTHSSFIGHQFSMARAKKGQVGGTTTFDWHCEPGSNWFVQISGTKEWYLMDTKYSSYMKTNHTGVGIRVLRTSDGPLMRDLHDRLPLEYVKLSPGDLIYNPDWYWHTVRRDEGISIGVAMREYNFTNMYNLNAAYSTVIAVNHIFKNIGLERLFKKDWWLFG